MGQRKSIFTALMLVVPIALESCAVPSFDIPREYGAPTIRTIVQRITCELVEMVKDGSSGEAVYPHRVSLLAGNFETAMSLSLEITHTGELSPNFNFPTVSSDLAINAGLKLSRSRTHNFTRHMHFSMKELYERWKEDHNFGKCPDAYDTNLAGKLGLEQMVSLQFSAREADISRTLAKGAAFGGTITFGVTRNINSAGPKWTLSNFVGPGNLGKLERKSTNKLTFAFATAVPVVKTKGIVRQRDRMEADDFLTELLFTQRN